MRSRQSGDVAEVFVTVPAMGATATMEVTVMMRLRVMVTMTVMINAIMHVQHLSDYLTFSLPV